VIQFAHHLKEAVIFPVPHRQYVFSIPKIIRKFFLYNRKLLGKLSQCASKSISKFLRTVLGKQHGVPGIVMVIQTFTAKSTLLEITPVGILTYMPWSQMACSWTVDIFTSCPRWIFSVVLNFSGHMY
jgi:hypothetical protein